VEYGLMRPILGLALACISASMCWLLSVVVTEHPLLPRLQLSATGLCRFLNSSVCARRDSIG
jgi:hypothetical protein